MGIQFNKRQLCVENELNSYKVIINYEIGGVGRTSPFIVNSINLVRLNLFKLYFLTYNIL